jgi:hypothetical protein
VPVTPYKRTPEPPDVALLLPDGMVVSEHGERLSLDALPKQVRVWASYDVVHRLVRDGHGEALCWNSEEIRWRHRRFEEGWRHRPSDVAVLRTVFPIQPEQALRGLVRWRDWLARYGASPTGTTGSAAWSLLRARITKPLWLGWGSRPPILQTMGGRQQLGPSGRGRFDGKLELWDMPAAYASELGHLPYGGRWYRSDELEVARTPEWWAGGNRCVFVRATVRLADGLGPLPRRPRRRISHQEALIFASYPSSSRMTGVWTWQELAAAERHGARIVKVREFWVHVTAQRPFLPWWAAIQDGRSQPGLAGGLAKMTGNALWGQFCMDPGGAGSRTVHGKLGRHQRTKTLEARRVGDRGGRPASHDLAETVSGRVRARLFEGMAQAREGLLSAHTDGMWLQGGALIPDGWRRKELARRVDLLGPQTLRYWPPRGAVRAVVSGVPPELAEEQFQLWWDEQRTGGRGKRERGAS